MSKIHPLSNDHSLSDLQEVVNPSQNPPIQDFRLDVASPHKPLFLILK